MNMNTNITDKKLNLVAISAGSVMSHTLVSLLRTQRDPDCKVRVGRLTVLDRDHVLPENLARGPFTTAMAEAKRAKALAVADVAAELAPDVEVETIVGSLEDPALRDAVDAAIGGADLVASALDNSAAHLELGRLARKHAKMVVVSQVVSGGVGVVTRTIPAGACLACVELGLGLGLQSQLAPRRDYSGGPDAAIPEQRIAALDPACMAAAALLAGLVLQLLERPDTAGTEALVAVHALRVLEAGPPAARLFSFVGQTTQVRPRRLPDCPICSVPEAVTAEAHEQARRLFEQAS